MPAPGNPFASLTGNFALVRSLTAREIQMRYRESVLGFAWSVLSPLMVLAVYAFVFGYIFKSRWNEEGSSTGNYAIALFAGLSVYTFFAEVVGRSPTLITGNANLARKVVFPLEILTWVAIGTALFGLAVNLVILCVFMLGFGVPLPWTIALFPLVLVPLVLLTAGISWFLAVTTPFFRDLGQIVSVLLMALMFVSPIFYPVTVIPPAYRGLLYLNPLTPLVEQSRAVLVFGGLPSVLALLATLAAALLVFWAGYWWFAAARRAAVDLI